MKGVLPIVVLALSGCFVPSDGGATPYYQDLLDDAPFQVLVVEVDHAPGRRPSAAALQHLQAELANVTSKSSIELRVEQTLADDADERWTSEELIELERATRTQAHEAPRALLHVLYPAGAYEREGVAGITISGPVLGPVVVFKDSLDDVQSPLGPFELPEQARDEIERATLLHEAGHAMGLVDNGLPMVKDHEDPEHEGHSRNEASVMYWQVESLAGLRQFLLRDGSVPAYFDADDRADMRAVGGK